MKRQLRFMALFLAVIAVYSLCACAKNAGIVYQDDTVTVKEVTLSKEKKYSSMEWLDLTPADFFDESVIIATGKITNLRDVEVTYTKAGEQRTELMALFDFEVSEYLSNSTASKDKRILTVGYPFESDFLVQDVPVLENGKEFILFLQHPNDMLNGEKDLLKRASFMDVHVRGPYQLMCEKVDGVYIIPPNLRTYFTNTEKAKVTENIRQAVAARGTEGSYVFAVKADTAEKIIQEAAEAYLKGVG